ncbi:MAG: helix-turn-helix domain-containing protein [Nocardioides sp.]
MTTRLKQTRVAMGWSQSQLIMKLRSHANSTGTTLPDPATLKTQVSRWENGHRRPEAFYRLLLCAVYGRTEEELGLADHVPADRLPAPEMVTTAPISGELVTNLVGMLEQLVMNDSLIGPHAAIAPAEHQARFVHEICSNAIGPDRKTMLPVAARFAEFVGWLHHDVGNLAPALAWTNRACDYAHELGDARLISYVMMRKSNILAEDGQIGLSLGLADAAMRDSDLTPKLRAVIRRVRANALAVQGEQDAVAEELDRAMVEVTNVDGSHETFVGYCGPSYVEMEAGNCWIKLNQPTKALAAFERGLADWPDGQGRDRTLCLARLATAHATAGDFDAASAIGTQALSSLTQTHSGRTLAQVKVLRHRMLPASRSPEVIEFSESFDSYVASRRAG